MTRLLTLASLSCCLFAGTLLAQETGGSLLERLESETRSLAAAARKAVVDVESGAEGAAGAGTKGTAAGWVRRGNAYYLQKNGVVIAQRAAPPEVKGVLVGTPARLVLPYGAVGKASEVTVEIGGEAVKAQRIDGDPELGVAVFGLPDAVAKKTRGIQVEREWAHLEAGSLAIGTGALERGLVGLGLVSRADRRLGTLDVGGDEHGAALLGTRRTLIGLRGVKEDWAACAACHVGAGQGQNLPVMFARNNRRFVQHHGAPKLTYDDFIAGPVIGRVLDDIEKHGSIRHGYAGVVLGDTVGSGKERGVMITAVLDGSPAQKAGLKAGQRVAAIDGLSCPSTTTLSRAMVMHRPGETVALTLTDGQGVEVRLADRKEAQKEFITPESVGMECCDIGPGLRSFLKIGDDVTGVAVLNVQAGSSAQRAGLRRGDILTWGGGGAISDVSELNAALAGARGNLALRGLRDGRQLSFTLWVSGAKRSTR